MNAIELLQEGYEKVSQCPMLLWVTHNAVRSTNLSHSRLPIATVGWLF